MREFFQADHEYKMDHKTRNSMANTLAVSSVDCFTFDVGIVFRQSSVLGCRGFHWNFPVRRGVFVEMHMIEARESSR